MYINNNKNKWSGRSMYRTSYPLAYSTMCMSSWIVIELLLFVMTWSKRSDIFNLCLHLVCFFLLVFFLILTVNGCNWGYGIVWLHGIDTGRCCNRYNNIVRYVVWFVDIIRTIRTRLWTLGIWVLFVNEQLAYSSWPISWSKPIICLWQRDKCIFHKRAALISCF